MSRESIVEAMVRAMCAAIELPENVERNFWLWKSDAKAALTAVEAQGFVLVPKVATEDMLFAMGKRRTSTSRATQIAPSS
jgi:hypothetical protein